MTPLKEPYLQQLLSQLYQEESVNVYDELARQSGAVGDDFTSAKGYADRLVEEKLAKYEEGDRSRLQITNYGRYWMLQGGYAIFLRDGKDRQKEKANQSEKEKLLEARLRLTHYRLTGFWLALIISSIGFALSVINLYLFLAGKK